MDNNCFDYHRAFSRNIGVVTEAEQALLRSKTIAIPGCGGVGGIYAVALARAGFSRFKLCDFDTFEVENFNRQFSARMSTLGKPKVEVVAADIYEINPQATVEVFTTALDSDNMAPFLDGADMVADALDFFAFAARDSLFPKARELGIPVISAAPLGMGSCLMVFTKNSMPYEEYFQFKDSDNFETKARKFALGVGLSALQLSYIDASRISLKDGRGPSHVVGVMLCASLVVSAAVKLATGRGEVKAVPYKLKFDAWVNK